MSGYERIVDAEDLAEPTLIVTEARLKEIAKQYEEMVKAAIERSNNPFHREDREVKTAAFIKTKRFTTEWFGFYACFCHCFPWTQKNYDRYNVRISWSAIDISEIRDDITSIRSFLNFVTTPIVIGKGHYTGHTFKPLVVTTTIEDVPTEMKLVYKIVRTE